MKNTNPYTGSAFSTVLAESPTVVENEQLVMVDCDDTLVMWETSNPNFKTVKIVDPYDGKLLKLKVHAGHVKVLKDRKARGSFVIVWSAGGYKWAKAVVEALGLTSYVDLICSKPLMYIDDKKAEDILGEHLYLGPNSKYGTTNTKEKK